MATCLSLQNGLLIFASLASCVLSASRSESGERHDLPSVMTSLDEHSPQSHISTHTLGSSPQSRDLIFYPITDYSTSPAITSCPPESAVSAALSTHDNTIETIRSSSRVDFSETTQTMASSNCASTTGLLRSVSEDKLKHESELPVNLDNADTVSGTKNIDKEFEISQPPDSQGIFKDGSEQSLATEALEKRDAVSTQVSKEYFNISNLTNYDNSKTNLSDDCKFMSFEEWKKQKDAESRAEAAAEQHIAAIPQVQVIDRESTSFTPTNIELTQDLSSAAEEQGRTYKDKFNYASVDCAATIVKTNSDAKGASAILTEVKDSYLLNKCSTVNKFIVIELCQDILVSSVVMGNFELFSSMFKTVKFSVSDRFPVTSSWHELGQFEAQNIRDMQTFHIENPLIWARYLKIEIISHYGNEFYCPISIVRVHGTTMMEEFKSTETHAAATPTSTQSIAISADQFLNESLGFGQHDEECKVMSPYLALNEFLNNYNSSNNLCDVPVVANNESHSTAEITTTKATQESIFQNIMKRLSLLELNATLSLLYIEEQSKLLSDAFSHLESRQERKFEKVMLQLNETVHSQLLYLENAVESIKTDSRLSFQMYNSQAVSLLGKFRQEAHSFSRELSFLRKVVAADTLIILSLLVYVILTRDTTIELTSKKEKNSKAIRSFPVNNRPNKKKKRRFVY